MSKHIVIIGAGPAGLTAALELQAAGIEQITIIEADKQVGGISRTINHNGNRIDIGGHRFFSKSDWVMRWWTDMLPLENRASLSESEFRYRGQYRSDLPVDIARASSDEAVLLMRNRLSRIYFNRQFFDYPLKLNIDFVRKLGFTKTISFGASYTFSRLLPIRPERSLEDFFINRFGRKLYKQFFKEYTEKVWGVSCNEISAEWGAQRVKSLSVTKALWHALRSALGLSNEKAKQTSLIESFLYPKHGPGQIWEAAAQRFVNAGGTLHLQHRVVKIDIKNNQVHTIAMESADGTRSELACSHVISTMPVKELVQASVEAWEPEVLAIARDLEYRDFITVGLLYATEATSHDLKDNWIYIQEPGVKVGRIQIFNNWSPYMVADSRKVWFGLEFFSKEGDSLWTLSDTQMKELAQQEMRQIGLVSTPNAQDAVVIRVKKAYPGYFGEAYKNFETIREAVDKVENLFLVGRNGMHRYNNQDHSMLTAREAASQIISGIVNKSRIWSINVGDDYHESK